MKKYDFEELGNVSAFQDKLISEAMKEKQVKKSSVWTSFLKIYIRQREIILHAPVPDPFEDADEDELPPSIKLLNRNINPKYENQLYRWGIKAQKVGNFRIIYLIYDYHKILFLHAFDKQYNGDIKRQDIEKAEKIYEEYLEKYPSKYL
ncbi:hypothetical protein A1A1_12247 [Planococcus antarcticus DSM 14505]|uniref:Uncharacterized protein n=1 Tax=Planococcus antarcticus DSM 14505 TaxID=1185653 RepID=A0AA87LQE3_9BACL|nr:type II toxin-antitoxin system RelE/ParE family toxin [Planococcus antarcticus]EIM06223.1 hypothetical protein A1A1_12247 [Planococcus antarcticus DSM 14505]